MFLSVLLIVVGCVLAYITKHGWSSELFFRPATSWETALVRIISIVGIGMALYGLYSLFFK